LGRPNHERPHRSTGPRARNGRIAAHDAASHVAVVEVEIPREDPGVARRSRFKIAERARMRRNGAPGAAGQSRRALKVVVLRFDRGRRDVRVNRSNRSSVAAEDRAREVVGEIGQSANSAWEANSSA
jgi:hypothetical protein